nr:MAG TPA: hypothetical protein [Caudoviricetes sp.]
MKAKNIKEKGVRSHDDILLKMGLPTFFYLNFVIEDDNDGQKKMKFLDDLKEYILSEPNRLTKSVQELVASRSKLIIEVVPNKLYIRLMGVTRFSNSILVRKFVPDTCARDEISGEELSLVKIYGYYPNHVFELATTPMVEYGMSNLPLTINGETIKVLGVDPCYGDEEHWKTKCLDVERLVREQIKKKRQNK